MQNKSRMGYKKHARRPDYMSPNQLTLIGFETPFDQALTKDNRWVKLSELLPWDSMVSRYNKNFESKEGRPPINGRIIIGAVIIKHMLKLSDRETIQQITENMFMQYFLGYSSFTNEAPFSPTLFVEIRERLSLEVLNDINEVIIKHHFETGDAGEQANSADQHDDKKDGMGEPGKHAETRIDKEITAEDKNQNEEERPPIHKGKLLMDATVAPQNITFPTDLKLLDSARRKSEQLIDILYDKKLHGSPKPRTYREIARKEFLNTAKKKSKTARTVYKANGKQIRFLRRNLAHIDRLIAAYDQFPLKPRDQKYLLVLHTVYEQQQEMHSTRTRRVDHRIVNIHQPHVRPIVRGKDGKKVEFGSKLQVSLSGGFAIVDKLDWENFNEGRTLAASVGLYKSRFGYYPEKVLADKIYCTRANRQFLKALGIKLHAKPLGRPSASALSNHVSPGERNPIEGKFGQAKAGYNMECIKAKLKATSESWIASIVLVLNLKNLLRGAPYCVILRVKLIIGMISQMLNIGTGRIFWRLSF